MTAPVADFSALVDRYAEMARTDTIPGREHSWGLALADAITDPDSHHSNASQLQKLRALLAAVKQVRTERMETTR